MESRSALPPEAVAVLLTDHLPFVQHLQPQRWFCLVILRQACDSTPACSPTLLRGPAGRQHGPGTQQCEPWAQRKLPGRQMAAGMGQSVRNQTTIRSGSSQSVESVHPPAVVTAAHLPWFGGATPAGLLSPIGQSTVPAGGSADSTATGVKCGPLPCHRVCRQRMPRTWRRRQLHGGGHLPSAGTMWQPWSPTKRACAGAGPPSMAVE